MLVVDRTAFPFPAVLVLSVISPEIEPVGSKFKVPVPEIEFTSSVPLPEIKPTKSTVEGALS